MAPAHSRNPCLAAAFIQLLCRDHTVLVVISLAKYTKPIARPAQNEMYVDDMAKLRMCTIIDSRVRGILETHSKSPLYQFCAIQYTAYGCLYEMHNETRV